MKKPLLVLKIGTASITQADGSVDEQVIASVAEQVARLHAQYRIVIVSSGAVGTGKRFLKRYSGKLAERKAAAAIGNPVLINTYSRYFAPHGIAIAQSLCERQHFSQRAQFLQLRETFQTLWKNGIIPIANENDVVSNLELRFSDNDELATLIAVGFDASALLLGTSVPGLYDKQGALVPRIAEFDESIMGMARSETSGPGLGGMISKLTFARLATRMGIKVVIFGVKSPGAILRAVVGETGTVCLPQAASPPARNKWLASGSLVMGRIVVDEGAKKAVLARNSLLAVGVSAVSGSFSRGEVCEIALRDEAPFAVARTRFSSAEIEASARARNMEIAHADDIVLL